MSETGSVKQLDTDSLTAWMNANVGDFAGPLTVEKFPGGQSNPTYKVETPNTNYVLRRKPAGKLLPGAHAVEREFRIMSALESQGVPVPHCFALCEDDSVLGTPFFIMEKVEGRIFWDPKLPEVPQEQRAAYYESMGDVIASLHNVDYVSAGLEDYGKPGNYFARQIGRWSKQYKQDEKAGHISTMDKLCEWLPDNIPDDGDGTTLVHGDYRCDNLIFHPTESRVIAVLDWELSTLGHPLADFTYHLMAYRTPEGLPSGMGSVDPVTVGLPSEAEYIAQYCRNTNRKSIENIDYYIAFNMWRLAAIIHGIKGRMIRGNASSDAASGIVSHLETLADCAWEQAQKAGAS